MKDLIIDHPLLAGHEPSSKSARSSFSAAESSLYVMNGGLASPPEDGRCTLPEAMPPEHSTEGIERGPGPAARAARMLALVSPGLLVAATGVGAGDLATAAFTGSRLGVAVLWAVVLGASLKYLVNEGLARWQLATGETLLEGALRRLGRPVQYGFGAYFLLWSFFVGSALISACGVTVHAIVPVFPDAATGKVVFGMSASLVGLALVLAGGFSLFEKVMSACIGLMFVTVLVTAALVCNDWEAVVRGMVVPRIPDAGGEGLGWTVALIGGVGGTLTMLCYGYWIREKGRSGPGDLTLCRIDLAAGYLMTALFGLAMVVIGGTIEVEGRGAGLVVSLADALDEPMGDVGRWAFLLGAFGAVFSSLLGVWQAVPYIFADYWSLVGRGRGLDASGSRPGVDTRSRPYRVYLVALAVVPMLGLLFGFREIQKVYAVFGALFMPLLAVTLLLLNGRSDWVGPRFRNRPLTTTLLVATVALFFYFGYRQLRAQLGV
jgi:Mn2+/Fe2+ NRAMP family transporter